MRGVTTRTSRRSYSAFLLFVLVVYLIVSVAIATATANSCNQVTGGHKSWVYAPPHWVCEAPEIRIG